MSAREGNRALRPGHELTLLKGSEALFRSMVEAIAAAQREVLLETYMFEFANSALAIAEALEQAAKRRITVRVVVDGIGTGDVPPEWQQRWRDAGLHWRVFNPARGWRVLLPKRWRRLHRKLCVVDGRIGFCGGINLVDDLYDPNHGALDEPRFDFSVRVLGPLVADMHDTMTRLWTRLQIGREVEHHDVSGVVQAVEVAAEAGTDMADEGMKVGVGRETRAGARAAAEAAKAHPRATRWKASATPVGALASLVLRDNVRFRRSIEGNYRRAISLAKSEILIANAYFIPGMQLQRALLNAARRGVRVTLLLQGRYEYFMQYHASRAVYGVMLNAGIQIIEYDASFLHAKVAVMDADGGAIATVGSSNLDPLSLLLAREANVFVRDDAFSAELRGHLLDAIARGRRVERDAHTRWPIAARGRNWLAYGVMRALLFASGKRY